MEIIEVRDEKLSHVNGGLQRQSRGQTSEAETRTYDLDKEKALKKKLKATEKEEVQITSMAGGVRIILNTGAYELLKLSAEHFYSCENDAYKFQTIPVVDRKGNHVETKFKVCSGKSPVYTFNMYHTKSSCLVNGKKVNHFMDHDFSHLIKGIETFLEGESMSVADVNAQFQTLLNQYKTTNDPEMQTENCSQPLNVCGALPSTSTCTSQPEETNTAPAEPASQNEVNSHKISPDHSDARHDVYITLLQSIAESVNSLQTSLESHIQTTDRNLGQIRDEIQSIKRQNQCENEHKGAQIEDIKTAANDLKQNVNKNYEGLTRRLQQVTDLIRNMPARSLPCDGERGERSAQPNHQVQAPSEDPERDRTLLIGSSIVKGIQPRGLATNVELVKMSGAKIKDVSQRLDELDTRIYNDVIIHVGGNDVSDGKQTDASYREIRHVTHKLQGRGCKVHLCTVCPRSDADVSDYNSRVRQVCRETGATLIDCYQAFVYGNGDTVKQYFSRDGIHLNQHGSRTLVSTINSHAGIIRDRDSSKTPRKQDTYVRRPRQVQSTFPRQSRNTSRQCCQKCGLRNHTTAECRCW